MMQTPTFPRISRAAAFKAAALIVMLAAASMAGAAERVVLAEYFTNLF